MEEAKDVGREIEEQNSINSGGKKVVPKKKNGFLEIDLYRLPDKKLEEDVIEFDDLQKCYKLPGRGEMVVALKSASLMPNTEFYPIKKGEFVMIRGPSGGGKTTLLNLIGSIDSPSTGELKILGETINKKSKDSFLSNLRLKHIGFVF